MKIQCSFVKLFAFKGFEKSELFLPVLHLSSMVFFLLVLLCCVFKKQLINCFGCLPFSILGCLRFNRMKKRLKGDNLEKAKNIYEEQKLEIKKAASDVIKEKLKDG